MAAPVFKNPVIRWIDHRLPIFSYLHHEAYEYPTPKNLNYWWNFGSLAGFMLIVMIVTGLILAMQYTPHVDHAFTSVERIMRDVNWGWLLRYLHMNGASMFFVVVYIHIFRGLYFGSYKAPRELLWQLGVLIYLLMMATAFMGYVLPWGQMSFWGATVITNLFSAIPYIGDSIVTLLWGRSNLLRVLAITGMLAGVAYIFTPLTASGALGSASTMRPPAAAIPWCRVSTPTRTADGVCSLCRR